MGWAGQLKVQTGFYRYFVPTGLAYEETLRAMKADVTLRSVLLEFELSQKLLKFVGKCYLVINPESPESSRTDRGLFAGRDLPIRRVGQSRVGREIKCSRSRA